jgi:hypothetical protein
MDQRASIDEASPAPGYTDLPKVAFFMNATKVGPRERITASCAAAGIPALGEILFTVAAAAQQQTAFWNHDTKLGEC